MDVVVVWNFISGSDVLLVFPCSYSVVGEEGSVGVVNVEGPNVVDL